MNFDQFYPEINKSTRPYFSLRVLNLTFFPPNLKKCPLTWFKFFRQQQSSLYGNKLTCMNLTYLETTVYVTHTVNQMKKRLGMGDSTL